MPCISWRARTVAGVMRKIAVWAVAILIPAAIASYWLVQRAAVSAKDGVPLVRIEGGVFTMGDDEFFPLREVYVSPFYIDAVEVTTARYAKFLEANGALAPPDEWERVDLAEERRASGHRRVVERRGCLLPVGRPPAADRSGVGEGGARRRSAQVSVGQRGARRRQGRLTRARRSMRTRAGSNASARLEAGRSREGVYDLEGNVSEWVGDWFTESFSVDDVRNPQGPGDGREESDPRQRLARAGRAHRRIAALSSIARQSHRRRGVSLRDGCRVGLKPDLPGNRSGSAWVPPG